MINDVPSLRPAMLAAIAASLLMLISGLTYRLLATPVDKTPIDPDILQTFPLQIGDWIGQRVPLDTIIARATSADALINRKYSRRNGLQTISFYMACGVNVHELLGHRPESCYTGAGWTLIDRRSVELPLDDGTKLPCDIFKFFRGGLDNHTVTVLNYFIVDGQCGDSSLLRPKAWHRFAAVDYAGQIQIVTSSKTITNNVAKSLVCSFAVDSAPLIARLFDDIKKARSFGESAKALEEK